MSNHSLIYICSPYSGKGKKAIKKNVRRARKYSCLAYKQGGIPFAPHLLFTQFLDDSKPDERESGIQLGLQMLSHCHEMWVFGTPSTGMAGEIAYAHRLGIPIRWFDKKARPVPNE